MITKESADCTHAWEDDDGNSCACYECVVKLAERLQSELDEDATDSGRHLALLIEERQRSERLQAIVDSLPRLVFLATTDGIRNHQEFGDSTVDCRASIYRRGRQWRYHRRVGGNEWADDDDPINAAEKARAT